MSLLKTIVEEMKVNSLGYVEVLIDSSCTEWFSFWFSRISTVMLYVDLCCVLRYKFLVITLKHRFFFVITIISVKWMFTLLTLLEGGL